MGEVVFQIIFCGHPEIEPFRFLRGRCLCFSAGGLEVTDALAYKRIASTVLALWSLLAFAWLRSQVKWKQ